jgi:hypothetical protein
MGTIVADALACVSVGLGVGDGGILVGVAKGVELAVGEEITVGVTVFSTPAPWADCRVGSG